MTTFSVRRNKINKRHYGFYYAYQKYCWELLGNIVTSVAPARTVKGRANPLHRVHSANFLLFYLRLFFHCRWWEVLSRNNFEVLPLWAPRWLTSAFTMTCGRANATYRMSVSIYGRFIRIDSMVGLRDPKKRIATYLIRFSEHYFQIKGLIPELEWMEHTDIGHDFTRKCQATNKTLFWSDSSLFGIQFTIWIMI